MSDDNVRTMIANRLAANYRFAVEFPNSGDDTAAMDANAMIEELAAAGYEVVKRPASRTHGTWSRYVRGCRCASCTDAARVYQNSYRTERTRGDEVQS